MRIVLAIDFYDPRRGGAAEWVRSYAAWLAAHGHDVFIVCARASEAAPVEIVSPGLELRDPWRRAVQLQPLAERLRPAIVHDTGTLVAADVFHPLMGSFWHNWVRQLRAWPLTTRCRRAPESLSYLRLQFRQLRRHRVLVACSRRVFDDMRQLGKRATAVVCNGIENSPAPPRACVEQVRRTLDVGDRLLVLLTAANPFLKGVPILLQAVSLLPAAARERFRVAIVGEFHEPRLQRAAARYGLADTVRFVGWVSDVAPYYYAADIYAHPTWHDAGSLSTMKALAAGCAVLTTHYDGSADLIEHGRNGLVLREPDPFELASALCALLDDQSRGAMQHAASAMAPCLERTHAFERLVALYAAL
jgi:UDP-glucose:(heptosyl)LPS alpha-1,3-glucosyltransferase